MNRLLFIIIGLAIGWVTIAQTPEAFKFQAVVRDGSGFIMPSRHISFRISLIEGGTVVYMESHTAMTNEFGLVKLEIELSRTIWMMRMRIRPMKSRSFSSPAHNRL